MAKENKYNSDAFWNLSNCVASSLEVMSDEEFRAEYATRITQDSNKGRALFAQTLKAFKQRHLVAARLEHAKQLSKIAEQSISMPKTQDARKKLLQKLIAMKPDMQRGLVTAQYRNLEDLPDEDVATALEQLAELGIWDGKIPEGSDEE